MDQTVADDIRRGTKNTEENCTKKDLHTQKIMML